MQIVTVVFNGAWKGVSMLTEQHVMCRLQEVQVASRTVVRFLIAAAAAAAVRVNGERHHPASL
jgi:hypothetical protein